MGDATPSPADTELDSEGSADRFSDTSKDEIWDARVTRQTCTRPENEAVLVVLKGKGGDRVMVPPRSGSDVAGVPGDQGVHAARRRRLTCSPLHPMF